MKQLLSAALLFGLSLGIRDAFATGADISGTWAFLVHYADLQLGDTRETIVFKQDGEKLRGTYSGPLGKFPVTGTVRGSAAVFSVEVERLGQTFTSDFVGRITSPGKMAGTLKYPENQTAKWIATRK